MFSTRVVAAVTPFNETSETSPLLCTLMKYEYQFLKHLNEAEASQIAVDKRYHICKQSLKEQEIQIKALGAAVANLCEHLNQLLVVGPSIPLVDTLTSFRPITIFMNTMKSIITSTKNSWHPLKKTCKGYRLNRVLQLISSPVARSLYSTRDINNSTKFG